MEYILRREAINHAYLLDNCIISTQCLPGERIKGISSGSKCISWNLLEISLSMMSISVMN